MKNMFPASNSIHCKVMASMEGVVAPKPEPIYDVPRCQKLQITNDLLFSFLTNNICRPLEVEPGCEAESGGQTPRNSWNPRTSWAS